MTARAITLAAILALAALSSLRAGEIAVSPGGLAQALAEAKPGDTIIMADGVYEGGVTLEGSGSADAPIVLKAAGKGAVIRGGARDGLTVSGSWVAVKGIRIEGAGRAGLGVIASAESPSEHVTVSHCVFADNGMWGCVTSHINHFVIEYCEAYGSKIQHGIYVANSGDDPVIRGNRLHDNILCGLHVNGDPECGGDGIISRALIENNVIYENGRKGGSGINMTHVQDSTIRNNLVYNNYASGISIYYDTGGESCASKRNKVLNNTFFFREGEGRFCLNMGPGSSDCRVENNIFVGGKYSTATVDASCLAGIVIDRNVYANHPGYILLGNTSEDAPEAGAPYKAHGIDVTDGQGLELDVASWKRAGYDTHSSFGKMPEFADGPAGNYMLAEGSVGIAMGAPLGGLVPTDIDGAARAGDKAYDCGCYKFTDGADVAR